MIDFGTIALGVRSGDRPDPRFCQCWTHLVMAGLRPGDKVLPWAIELPHHWAACVLAYEFLTETDCDTLLMLDDDMTFQNEDFAALRDHTENHSFDIVQGMCVTRKSGHAPIMLQEAGKYFQPVTPDTDERTTEVGMCGLAFTLIRRHVFTAIEEVKKKSELFFAWGTDGRGEDSYFCRLARKAGMRIGIDTEVSIGHRVPCDVSYDKKRQASVYHTYSNPTFQKLLASIQKAKEE